MTDPDRDRVTHFIAVCQYDHWDYTCESQLLGGGDCQDVTNGCLSYKSEVRISILPNRAQDQGLKGPGAASHFALGQGPSEGSRKMVG